MSKKLRGGKKSEEKKEILNNINMLFKGRNEAMKFVDHCGSMVLESKKGDGRTSNRRIIK